MRLFDQIKRPIQSLVFSPDGGTLAATSRKGLTIGLWNLRANSFRRWHPRVLVADISLRGASDGSARRTGRSSGV